MVRCWSAGRVGYWTRVSPSSRLVAAGPGPKLTFLLVYPPDGRQGAGCGPVIAYEDGASGKVVYIRTLAFDERPAEGTAAGASLGTPGEGHTHIGGWHLSCR